MFFSLRYTGGYVNGRKVARFPFAFVLFALATIHGREQSRSLIFLPYHLL